jgi:hypothetical protein
LNWQYVFGRSTVFLNWIFFGSSGYRTSHYAMFVQVGTCGPSGLALLRGTDLIVALGSGFAGTTGITEKELFS